MLIVPLLDVESSTTIFSFLNLGREEHLLLVQSITIPLSINTSVAAGFAC